MKKQTRILHVVPLSLVLAVTAGAAHAGNAYASFIGTVLLMNLGDRALQWLVIGPLLGLAVREVMVYTTPSVARASPIRTVLTVWLSGMAALLGATLLMALAMFTLPMLSKMVFVVGFLSIWLGLMSLLRSRLAASQIPLPSLLLTLWIASSLLFATSWSLYAAGRYVAWMIAG